MVRKPVFYRMLPSPSSTFLWGLLLCLLCLLTGCDSYRARQEADAGIEAIQSCQFKIAYNHFKKADEYYPNHHEILIGLSISEFLYFLDTPDINTILSSLGFRWNVHSLCKTLADQDSDRSSSDLQACHAFDSSKLTASIAPNEINALDPALINPNLTWQHIISSLQIHQHLLDQAAEHAYAAAKSNIPHYHAGNFFGYDITIHASEIAMLSITANLLSTFLDIVGLYEWDFSVKKTIESLQNDEDNWLIQTMSNKFLQNKKNKTLPHTLDKIQQTINALGFVVPYLQLFKTYLPESDAHGCPIRNSLFHWETLPAGIIMDFEKASHILDASPSIASLNEFFDPEISIDLAFILQNPPALTMPTAELNDSAWQWHFQELQQQLNAAFDPPILDENNPTFQLRDEFSFRLNSAWLKWNPRNLL